jgi:hypothetical protein
MKRWFLRNPWLRPLAVFNYATILIQKTFRGYLTRKRKRKGFVKDNKKKRTSNAISVKSKRHQLDRYLDYIEMFKKKKSKNKVWKSFHFLGILR